MKKSRHLSIYEYFQQLQLEYIVTELRRKIYYRIKDKKFYERVLEYKKEKIEDIAERNSLVSIFSNPKLKKELSVDIYKDNYPNFYYSNEEDREKYEESDRVNYYSEESEVKIIDGKKMIIGKLQDVDFYKNVANVVTDKGIIPNIELKKIKRIL